MPYESEVKTWPQYEPPELETETVIALQEQGAPKNVYYVDRGAGATAEASKNQHEIWFFKSETQEYHGDSGSIVKFPSIALTEMKSTGIVT